MKLVVLPIDKGEVLPPPLFHFYQMILMITNELSQPIPTEGLIIGNLTINPSHLLYHHCSHHPSIFHWLIQDMTHFWITLLMDIKAPLDQSPRVRLDINMAQGSPSNLGCCLKEVIPIKIIEHLRLIRSLTIFNNLLGWQVWIFVIKVRLCLKLVMTSHHKCFKWTSCPNLLNSKGVSPQHCYVFRLSILSFSWLSPKCLFTCRHHDFHMLFLLFLILSSHSFLLSLFLNIIAHD